jgi:hypothetical protein
MTPLTLIRADQWVPTGAPEMDALTEEGALQEAQLVDVSFDPTRQRVGLLFDLRQALQLRRANTALLIFDGVREIRWASTPRLTLRTAWTVVGSVPEIHDGTIRLSLFFAPDAEGILVARAGAFYVGDVPALPTAPPDFVNDSDEAIAAAMPTMQSQFEPIDATVLNA